MASTYVNDLRLNEMATGDQSGSWGTVTNTNLELIAEAFSYGTEAITTNADTHTTTIADGGTDPGRSMFLKYTGTLDSACTITIGPNTVSKLWFIENATSGSQNIIIKQGSGATVTIASGKTKVIYSDGVGSGAKMVDAFAALDVGSMSVDNITIDGTTIATGAATITTADNNAQLTLISTDADATVGPILKLYRNSASPADNDTVGRLLFTGEDDAGNEATYARIETIATDVSNGSENAKMEFYVAVNDTFNPSLTLEDTGAATFNSTIAAGAATFTTADNTNQLTLVSTDADANAGPNLNFRRNSASPADGDLTGQLTFTNNNDAGEGTDYVTIHALSADVSNGSEDAAFYIKTMSAGTLRQRISLTDTATVFNEDSIDLDFRVESDANTHMLFVDAGNNRVGVGTSSPTELLSIGNTSTQYTRIQFHAATNGASTIHFGDGTSGADNYRGYLNYAHDSDSMQFAINGAERMRIDSSGNLIIGKTSESSNTAGHFLSESGYLRSTRNGSIQVLNRITTDGEVISIQKDGSTRGSIGVNNGDPFISRASGSGMRWYNGAVVPTNDAGSDSNNTMDLGASGVRFKNGYFSGNLYGDGSNLTGISSGGVTFLGSVAATASATSLTLTSLDLTGYKFLYVIGNWLNQSSNDWIGLQSGDNFYQVANVMTSSSTTGVNFFVTCDLTTGVAHISASRANKRYNNAWQNSGTVGSGNATEYLGGTQSIGITNSTTTVGLYSRSGNNFGYASGNISGTERKFYLYGVA